MPNTTYGTPYAQSSDLVSNWPGVSLNVADRLDDVSFKGNGLNNQTGTTYTLVLTDAGKTVTLNNASAVTVTIPTNASVAYETGTRIYFTNQGAGVVTISPAGGVTLNNSISLAQHASAYVQKLANDTWVMVGVQAGVLQVKSTTKTDTFSTTSSSLTDVTGLSVSITPVSVTNKVLVMVSLSFAADASATAFQAAILRGSTQIALGDAAGSRSRRTWLRAVSQNSGGAGGNLSMTFLDSPATTSLTTYKIQISSDQGAAGTAFVNRNVTDTDGATWTRAISTITVMEVTP